MRSEIIPYTISDPVTRTDFQLETRFHENNVEIEVFHKGELSANVMLDVYDGKCQLVIADKHELDRTGGDNPQLVALFEAQPAKK